MARLFESDRVRLRAWGCVNNGCGCIGSLTSLVMVGGFVAMGVSGAREGVWLAIVPLVVLVATAVWIAASIAGATASPTAAAAAFLKHPVPATPLTPSERLVLPFLLQPLSPAIWGGTLAAAMGDAQFADPEEYPRPRAHTNVALAVALLANEAQGAVRLELGTRVTRVRFRRQTVPVLWVHPAGGATSWPDGSWEARLCALAVRRARRRAPDAETLFQSASGAFGLTEAGAVRDLCAALCARGVLTIAREPWALQWRANQGSPLLALTPVGATRLDEAPDPTLATLAERCARERPAVWAALTAAVAASFNAKRSAADRSRGASWTDAAGRVHDRWTLQADVAEIVGVSGPASGGAVRDV